MSFKPAQTTTRPVARPGHRLGWLLVIPFLMQLSACASLQWNDNDRVKLWQDAHQAAARFAMALPDSTEFHRQVQFGPLTVNIVSRDVLAAEVRRNGGDPNTVAGFAKGSFVSPDKPHQVWVVGDGRWVDQWALGHELAHVLGFDVDHPRFAMGTVAKPSN